MDTVAIDTRLDGRLAVLVRPAAPGPWPGVVMVHEAWGLDDVLRRQADRLASAGFVVLAPDLYGDGSRLRCVRATFAPSGRGPVRRSTSCRPAAGSCSRTGTSTAGWG